MEQQTVTTEKWEVIPDNEYPDVYGIWSKTEFPTYIARTCFASERNANIIAAAPELLAACMEFVRKCDVGEARSKRSYAQMKLAINKALGIK